MHTIDIIACVLFIVWLFGFVHIITAIVIVAVLYGITRRKSIIAAATNALYGKNLKQKMMLKKNSISRR